MGLYSDSRPWSRFCTRTQVLVERPCRPKTFQGIHSFNLLVLRRVTSHPPRTKHQPYPSTSIARERHRDRNTVTQHDTKGHGEGRVREVVFLLGTSTDTRSKPSKKPYLILSSTDHRSRHPRRTPLQSIVL